MTLPPFWGNCAKEALFHDHSFRSVWTKKRESLRCSIGFLRCKNGQRSSTYALVNSSPVSQVEECTKTVVCEHVFRKVCSRFPLILRKIVFGRFLVRTSQKRAKPSPHAHTFEKQGLGEAVVHSKATFRKLAILQCVI